MKNQANLRTKLQGAFGILAAASLLGAGSAAWTTNRLRDEMNHAVNGAAKMLDVAGQYSALASKARTANRNMLLYGMSHNQKIVEEQVKIADTAGTQLDGVKVQMEPLLDSPAKTAAFAAADSARVAWFAVSRDVVEMCRADHAEAANLLSQQKLRGPAQALDKAVSDLLDIARLQLEKSNRNVANIGRWSQWISGATILLSILLSIGGFVTIGRIVHRLGQTVEELTATADSLSQAAAQMSSSSNSLARIASDQAASHEETSAATEEISSISRQSADNAASAAQLVASVDARLREGDQSVRAMVESMEEIGASSNKVSKIIRVIDEIAFQTNILALNAAVEAARAGEAGLGFAVVADEVRTLAQRSAQAARDTSGLIEESLSKSKSGRERVEQVTVVFREISGNAGKLSSLIHDLKQGNDQQAAGIGQISTAIVRMDQVTQNTAASAQESAAAGAEVTGQAKSLRDVALTLAAMVGKG
jgi:methyl-accepting chemotaxis protein/methyl-accepting chemotaxis protein-1 (serine sensor receptor)